MDNVMYLKKIVSEDVKKKESSIPDYLLKFQPLDIDKDEMIFNKVILFLIIYSPSLLEMNTIIFIPNKKLINADKRTFFDAFIF